MAYKLFIINQPFFQCLNDDALRRLVLQGPSTSLKSQAPNWFGLARNALAMMEVHDEESLLKTMLLQYNVVST